ncbi:MAG: c-type cytochrome [Sphingobacteriales bacterium]|jgi:mono/diheme cytochrome c family protein|nr:c-type cytochrome [Sphingobacteriales bacterium]MBK7527701.1 c-type cytochrome [Sphingobacteriales bacterium]MBP9141822.1 c-type cytochrome [Chitinophagales bacterium]MCC7056959.1 c-type cytochrome [Chitinophagales bacterium]MDA0198882.1 c-type cytochrome [Bacteroidota bacterium]
MMYRFFAFLCIVVTFWVGITTSTFAAVDKNGDAYKKGEALYKANCASCHKMNEKLVGPPSAGMHTRYSKEWLHKWIRNSQDMVKAGDPQAVAVFKENNGAIMTPFANLTDAEIDNIITYVEGESEAPAAAAAAPAGGAAPNAATAATGAGADKSTDEYKKGEALYKANCTSCHKMHEKLVGPASAGMHTRYSKEWLHKWIHNSQDLIKAGDPQAVAIFKEFNSAVMTPFTNLSDAEIDNIIAYVKAESEAPSATAPAGGVTAGSAAPSSINYLAIIFGVLAVILLVFLLVLSRITGRLSDSLREKMGKFIPIKTSSEKMWFSKKIMATLALLAVVLFGYHMTQGAINLGRQTNYAPDQPIKFSHKLHAGTQKIPCQYCHSGAAKGKSSVIPAPNLCMNCHKAIKKGPTYGETEIAKIYNAVGWDPEKMAYKENYQQKPIEWVRVHNLPDYVYFNHSQHVVAGGLQCQTCHGPVEEMDVLKQHSTLNMGWCVNCHRQTEVQFTNNNYYSTYEKMHEDLKSGKIKKVTVDDIGGTECMKCHY